MRETIESIFSCSHTRKVLYSSVKFFPRPSKDPKDPAFENI